MSRHKMHTRAFGLGCVRVFIVWHVQFPIRSPHKLCTTILRCASKLCSNQAPAYLAYTLIQDSGRETTLFFIARGPQPQTYTPITVSGMPAVTPDMLLGSIQSYCGTIRLRSHNAYMGAFKV